MGKGAKGGAGEPPASPRHRVAPSSIRPFAIFPFISLFYLCLHLNPLSG